MKAVLPGRRTSSWHTLPIVAVGHNGERYLVPVHSGSDGPLGLRTPDRGRLTRRGRRRTRGDQPIEAPARDRTAFTGADRTRRPPVRADGVQGRAEEIPRFRAKAGGQVRVQPLGGS